MRAAWAALALALCACGGARSPVGPSGPPPSELAVLTRVADSSDWSASTPADEGLDASRLADLAGRIRRRDYGSIDSLLVVRHGRLVVEEYFNGGSVGQAHTAQSMSKSVTSLVTGLAVARGALRVTDRVVTYFPSYEPLASMDDRKSALTIRDLLTMRSGFDWTEGNYTGSPLQRLNDGRCDWLRFMLDWPMREAPGTRWEYVSGGVILLGGVVTAATGMRMDLFGDRELFEPLGVTGAYWIGGLPDGLPHTGGGLYMRARDMAKLGALMISGGRWQGRQVVPEGWIRESTAHAVARPRTFGAHQVDYGYLWWLLDEADPMNPRARPGDIITASGARGQWIFAVPAQDLVMVTTAENGEGPNTVAPVDFLYTHVLAAVVR